MTVTAVCSVAMAEPNVPRSAAVAVENTAPPKVTPSAGAAALRARMPCAKGHDDRSSELCAAWKSADASEDAAAWAGKAYSLSRTGMVLGWMTFVAAAVAALFAGLAANYTRKQFLVSQRVEDASLVFAFPSGAIEVGDNQTTFVLNMVVTNVGRSAARIHNVLLGADETVLDVTLKADETRRWDGLVTVQKVDDDHQSLAGWVVYSTPLRVKARWIVEASILNHDGMHTGGVWALVRDSYGSGGLI